MTHLPSPDPTALAHSNQLLARLQQQLSEQKWLSFADFMERTLYSPGLGYYSAGAHKLGEAGDFTTAPEISALFGQSIARQLQQIMSLSQPEILELGAGSGKLAVDILTQLEQSDHLPSHYRILEVSPDLKQRQQQTIEQKIPHLASRVSWLSTLPDTVHGAVIANEVLDALPVHLVYLDQSRQWQERGVCWRQNGLSWEDQPLSHPELQQQVASLQLPADYLTEINLAARGLIHSLSQRLQQGGLLLIDYGFGAREYFHPQRNRGTLMCHYRHHSHDDPFFLPGLQDITAHVNFTDVAECAIDAGLKLGGYTSQAFFLINCGITDLMQAVSPSNTTVYLPLSAQLQKLTSPAEMGELFKVIAFTRDIKEPLLGFTQGGLSRHL